MYYKPLRTTGTEHNRGRLLTGELFAYEPRGYGSNTTPKQCTSCKLWLKIKECYVTKSSKLTFIRNGLVQSKTMINK